MLYRILTRQKLDAIMKLKLLLITLLTLCITKQVSASQSQSAESIKKAVSLYVASNLPVDTEYKLTQGESDSRLRLPFCTESLEIFSRSQSLKAGRNSIGVKCNSLKKWTIYTPIFINLYKNIVVLTHPIRRGDTFSQTMFEIEKRDVSLLRSGFITDPQSLLNKLATRNLNSGSVVTKSNYTEPKLIKRGDAVTIQISSQNLNISVAGVAVMDGKKGQLIKVKNLKSQQIVQATVKKPGQVIVIF